MSTQENVGESSAKRHKTSDIWEGFWILKQRGPSAKCPACKRILAKSGKRVASLVVCLHCKANIPNGARRAIAMNIISNGLSLSVVEDCSYQQMICYVLQHHLTFPLCGGILDRDVMNLYEREKGTLRCIISEASGGLSFTVDHWKSKPTEDNNYVDDTYICVTACFVWDSALGFSL